MTTPYEYELGRRAGVMQAINDIVCGNVEPPTERPPEIICDNCTRTVYAGDTHYGHSCSAECWADMHGWPEPEEDTFEEEDAGEEPE